MNQHQNNMDAFLSKIWQKYGTDVMDRFKVTKGKAIPYEWLLLFMYEEVERLKSRIEELEK